MDRHGTLIGDFGSWAERLFYLPGDAVIAHLGPTIFGRMLELTPSARGSIASAAISGAAWLLAIWVIVYLSRFFVDAVDPTYRQQQRERRRAARVRRAQRSRRASWIRPFTRAPSRRTGRRPA